MLWKLFYHVTCRVKVLTGTIQPKTVVFNEIPKELYSSAGLVFSSDLAFLKSILKILLY